MREKVRDTILLFRQELEKYLDETKQSINSDWNNPYAKFPSGACKSTSWMLREFLRDNFSMPDIFYVFGINEKGDTHGWLEIEDFIIDLTADQFSEQYPKAIIIEKKKSDLHAQFKKQEKSLDYLSRDHDLMDIKNEIKIRLQIQKIL